MKYLIKLNQILKTEKGALTLLQSTLVMSFGVILLGAVIGFKQSAKSVVEHDNCLIKLDSQVGEYGEKAIDLAEPDLNISEEDCGSLEE